SALISLFTTSKSPSAVTPSPMNCSHFTLPTSPTACSGRSVSEGGKSTNWAMPFRLPLFVPPARRRSENQCAPTSSFDQRKKHIAIRIFIRKNRLHERYLASRASPEGAPGADRPVHARGRRHAGLDPDPLPGLRGPLQARLSAGRVGARSRRSLRPPGSRSARGAGAGGLRLPR